MRFSPLTSRDHLRVFRERTPSLRNRWSGNHRLPAWLGNSLFWIFAAVVGLLLPQKIAAQQSNSEAFEVIVFDPLFDSHTASGFRPVTVKLSTADGQMAAKDREFWIVQKLFNRDLQESFSRVRHKKFILKAGTNQVTVSFAAECYGPSFNHEHLHIETDGNLDYSARRREDFCSTVRSEAQQGAEFSNLNILMIQSEGILSWPDSQRFLVDFSRNPPQQQLSGNRFYAPPESILGLYSVLLNDDALPKTFFNEKKAPQQLAALPQTGTSNADDLTPHYQDASYFVFENDWFSVGTPEQMPGDWNALVNLDLLLINEKDLGVLSAEQLLAVESWLAAGGRLALLDCGPLKQSSPKVIGKLKSAREPGDQQPHEPGWMLISEKENSGPLGKFFPLSGEKLRRFSRFEHVASEVLAFNECRTQVLDNSTEIGARDILFVDYLHGRIVCVERPVSEFEPDDWRRLLLASYGNGRGGNVRMLLGESALSGKEFPDFEVAGVGKPPNLLFLGLITLFAVLAGPVAYTLLYRKRRVNFLLVVVPAISLFATLSLLVYVVWVDGFQFQARRISFSRLDQKVQRVVTLTKHAVFSGTNPKFYLAEENALLLPTSPEERDLQRVEFYSGGSRLAANWIRARMPHQITSASVRATDEGLDVKLKQVAGQLIVTASNRLGSRLSAVLLKVEGEWYELGDLAPGASTEARKTTPQEFQSKVRPLFQKIRPQKPETFQALELQPEPLEGSAGFIELFEHPELLDAPLIENGQYIAVLESYTGAGQLKDYAKYQQQLHLIHGNW